jgi:type II secretory pathway component GspD/PulD (secretin)
MKSNIILTTLGSLMLSALVARAQDATPAPQPQPAEAKPDATAAAPAEAAAPAMAPTAAEAAPAATNATQVAQASTTEPAPATAGSATNAVTATTAAAATTNAPAAEQPTGSAIIPLIVIDDTPLLDAIRNLARQAGINLMIDPRVAYGQVDPATGKPTAQPTVSIRWENITADQALHALLNNYGLQAVEEPKVKITRITVKDPAAPDPLLTRTFQLQYASPSNVLAAVTASLWDKRSKVVADTRTSQLVLVATEKELIEIENLIAKLDSPTKQVLIEARLVETSMNPKTIKGIDWSGTLGNSAAGLGQGTTVRFGNNPLGGVTMDDAGANSPNALPGLAHNGSFGFNPAAAFLSADGLSATLSFLNASSEAKVLASPRTVTLDNEPAHIEAGQLYPIVNVTAGTAQTAGGSQINYSNLTVRLDVTPRISANNLINLRVVPQVMRLVEVRKFEAGSAGASGGSASFDVPIFATRNLDTRVMIPSGNTLVMGGLISDSVTENNIKIPVLGDIPFLGPLFRQDSKSRDKENLIVFVTPTIVQDEDFQPTKSDYLKTPVATSFSDDAEWSAWDSGRPRDWSKSGVKGGAVQAGPATK